MKKTLKDVQLNGKTVLMRADFNVPLDNNGSITDDSRIRAAMPSIEYILDKGAKLVLMSHLGRPKGEVNPEFSLDPVAKRLSELSGRQITKTDDCIGPSVSETVSKMSEGDVVLLENLRFHKEEKNNDPEFAKQLASLAEVFVEDAFGTCHRAHASTVGVTEYLPSVAGFLVQKEIEYFEKVTSDPDKPFCLILGGAKVADKIPVIENMLDKVDYILIGGAMAYTFLKSKGKNTGNSRLEEGMLETVNTIFEKAGVNNVNISLPEDHVVAQQIKEAEETKVVGVDIPEGWIGLDIGPRTIKSFQSILEKSKTIVWNGPVGLFEMAAFSEGTKAIAEYIAGLNATTVIGGGDTAAAINKLSLGKKMSHMSTGGGASLEYLEGKQLPGIAALEDK
jgi:3-phosphoglycerate kinase